MIFDSRNYNQAQITYKEGFDSVVCKNQTQKSTKQPDFCAKTPIKM